MAIDASFWVRRGSGLDIIIDNNGVAGRYLLRNRGPAPIEVNYRVSPDEPDQPTLRPGHCLECRADLILAQVPTGESDDRSLLEWEQLA